MRGSYKAWARSAGAQAFSENEIAELDDAEHAILDHYGPAFPDQYGWAHDALRARSPRYRNLVEARQRRSPNLLDLARATGTDSSHFYYRRASAVVHGAEAALAGDVQAGPREPSLEGIDMVLPLAAGSFSVLMGALAGADPDQPDRDLLRVGVNLASAIADNVAAACAAEE